jgi:signal transduction histidine kinase/DNA-binding response OmpR family regulator
LKITIIILFLFITTIANAIEPISLDDSINKKNFGPIGENIEYCIEKNNKIEISNILTQKNWIKSKKYIISLKVNNEGYWFRFILKNNTNINLKIYAKINYAFNDYIDFFTTDESDQYVIKKSGDAIPFSMRDIPYRMPIFPITIKSQETSTVYLRIQSEKNIVLPLVLIGEDKLIDQLSISDGIQWAFFGLFISMILYHIFLYYSVKDFSYVYFALAILSFFFLKLIRSGIAFQFFWPDSPNLGNMWRPMFLFFGLSMGGMFFNSYIKTQTFSLLLYNTIKILSIINLLLSLVTILSPYSMENIANISCVISCLFFLFLSVYASIKKIHSGYFILSSFGIFFVVSIIYQLEDLNVILVKPAFRECFELIPQIASASAIILLSFGLAYRINILRKEKFKAQEQVIINLNKIDKLKDEFLANTSHELKTPLNGIIGLAESLKNQVFDILPERQKSNISLIISSGLRLSNLINDILDYSRLKNRDIVLQKKFININLIVNNVIELSQPLFKNKKICLKNLIPQYIPYVYADEERMLQVFFNLIGNAIKFTHEGTITVSATTLNDSIKVIVSDTGIGIPPEKHKAIFESFEQGDERISEEYGGTGIGLFIVKHIIDLHGGEIWVESEKEKGSQFFFTLPITNMQNPTEKYSLESIKVEEKLINNIPKNMNNQFYRNEIITKNNSYILVVDDDPINLQVVANHLADEGYNVYTASNGLEALEYLNIDDEKIEDNDKKFDLVLLDIMMPNMSGYELCRKIREFYSIYELPILFLSVRNCIEDLVAGFESGANDFITKPIKRQELIIRSKTLIKLKQLVHEQKEIRYKQLQNRMNPHFLFNAIHSINIIVLQDPEAARIALSKLADIYRFLINQASEKNIPLETEINFTKKYLELEKLMYKDRLEFIIKTEGDLDEILIPPLSIQPIAENSIKHGLDHKTQGGFVHISVTKKENILAICVLDNGLGLETENLYSRSLGNILQRLKLNYKKAEMEIKNANEGGVIVIIKCIL